MAYCPGCGTENEGSSAFCKNCGKPLTAGVQAPPPEQGSPPGEGGIPPPPLPQPPPYPPRGMPSPVASGFGYLPEGPVTGPVTYGGFWIRFVTVLIDALIVGFVFGMPFRFVGGSPRTVAIFGAIGGLIFFGAYFTYFILMTGWRGQTVGKMAMRLRVVNQDLTPVDYGTSAAREFSKILSAIILYIGFIMAGFDAQKRALHDRIAKTYVVKY